MNKFSFKGCSVKKLFALVCLLLMIPQGFAFRELGTLEKHLHLLKVQNVLIQNNEFIKLAITRKLATNLAAQPELFESEDPTQLIEELERVAKEELQTQSDVRFGEKFKEYFKDLYKETRTTIRTQGIGLGVMFVSIEVGQILGGIILASAGQPQLGATLGALPLNEILLFGTVALKKLLALRKTYESYGGKQNYKAFKQIHREVLDTLNLKGKGGIVIPYAFNNDQELEALSLSHQGFLGKMISRFSPHRHKLDLVTLKRFLKDHDLKDREEIQQILKEEVEDSLKITFIVNELKKDEPKIFQDLRRQFPKNFIQISAFELSADLKNWSLSGLAAENKNEFMNFATNVPQNMRVLDVVKIWAKCLYPVVIDESKGLGYQAYRRMVKALPTMEIKAELSFAESWSSKWNQIFSSYFREALN